MRSLHLSLLRSRRQVVDLRYVNSHLLEMVCRYETLKDVRGMIQRGDYLFSLDLADGSIAKTQVPS